MTHAAKSSGRSVDTSVIRDCTIDDAAAIAEIYNEHIRSGGSTMDTELKTTAGIENLIRGFNDRETILVLEDNNGILGWGIIKRYSDRIGYRVCCETSVYLRGGQVRRGYGTRMKLALIDRCKQLGYHHLVAKIFAVNEASIAYNERLGYEVVGRQREIGFRDGKWQDVVIMQLILDDVPPYKPELG
ncbi:MAG: GNAT family N-acetyltransferase [Acidobacteriota bacterium]|nr:GNAT family N-acetyltransferase [Acidobacteriota bacterium]